MEPAEILDGLARGGLSAAALAAATERRAETTPVFLRELHDYLAAPDLDPERTLRLFFIFHLFGEWREKTAYRPLARLLRLPTEYLLAILSDSKTETSHRVMAAVFDGDPQPLFDIILDEDADEFARARMFAAILMLTLRGEIERSTTEQFLRAGFTQIRPQQDCYVWEGWLDAIAMLGLVGFRDIVAAAFKRGSIDKQETTPADFERMLRQALATPSNPWGARTREYSLFDNTLEEFSDWEGFREIGDGKTGDDRNSERDSRRTLSLHIEPIVAPLRNVGRNDPCPCGSGKKYKKCCLQAGT